MTEQTCTASERTRARWMEEFRNLSQAEYDCLLQSVKSIVFDEGVAEEAFAWAMLKATEQYDGSVPLRYYVLRVARNFSINYAEKHKSEHLFTDMAESDDELENIGSFEDKTEDPYKLVFAKVVSELLRATAADQNVTTARERKTAERAAVIFEELVESVKKDTGPGVDEYDEQAETTPYTPVRSNLERRYGEILSKREGKSINKKTVEVATAYLRKMIRYAMVAWVVCERQKCFDRGYAG